MARFLTDAPQGRGYTARFAALDHQRHNVKIDEPIRRIKNLDVPADRGAALGQRFPLQAAHPLIEAFADRIVRLKPEYFTSRVVEVGDAPFRIGDDNSFLDGIEHSLQKSFLLRETDQIILHFLRPDSAKVLDQFL